ncbi:hypothetical protein KIL84_012113 [Mauremys mutica]|uniref:Uncharacterized protein n=1 Tax=Mauremys mutica TaxID=74926 RepID=A0A9D4B2X3_9SAUR|nr:hypothetical protein KIL84_012113 [Mauremys mutica]
MVVEGRLLETQQKGSAQAYIKTQSTPLKVGLKMPLALVLSPSLQLTYPKPTDSSARAVLVLGYQDYWPRFWQKTTKPNCSCYSYGCVLLPCPFVVHTLTCLQ